MPVLLRESHDQRDTQSVVVGVDLAPGITCAVVSPVGNNGVFTVPLRFKLIEDLSDLLIDVGKGIVEERHPFPEQGGVGNKARNRHIIRVVQLVVAQERRTRFPRILGRQFEYTGVGIAQSVVHEERLVFRAILPEIFRVVILFTLLFGDVKVDVLVRLCAGITGVCQHCV